MQIKLKRSKSTWHIKIEILLSSGRQHIKHIHWLTLCYIYTVIKWNSIPWNTSDNIFLSYIFHTLDQTWHQSLENIKSLKITHTHYRLYNTSYLFLPFFFFLNIFLGIRIFNAKWKMMNSAVHEKRFHYPSHL